MLYFRMLITMLVGLYTTRIVLQVLGISDYGIYSVIGGVVTMFTFINGSMAAGLTRYSWLFFNTDLKNCLALFVLIILLYSLLILFSKIYKNYLSV